MPAPLLVHNVFPAAWPGLGLALLVLAAAFGPRFGRWGGLVIGLLALYWLSHNHRAEGGVLVDLSPSHGIVATDLAGAAGLALAGWLLVRGRL
jgi:lipopolysaccharide export LptBFGC system permease protein LptF